MRVSKVTDSIEVLYTDTYPEEMHLRPVHGRLTNRSGFLVQDIYLYELFEEVIRKRNLLTGQILSTYQFTPSPSTYYEDFSVSGPIIHFYSYPDELYTYNMETEKFIDLPFSKNKTYRYENTYYSIYNGKGINVYDAVDEMSTKIFENEHFLIGGANNSIGNQNGLIATGILHSRFINEDTTFLLSCDLNLNYNALQVYDTQNGYLTILQEPEHFTINLIDSSDCSTITSSNLDYFHESLRIRVYPIPDDEDLLLLQYYIGADGYPEFVLFDKTTSEFDSLPNIVGGYYPTSFYKKDNLLYFLGHNGEWEYPDYFIFSLDLNTKEFIRHPASSILGRPLTFGSSYIDSTLFLVENNGTLNLYKFKNTEDIIFLDSVVDFRNAGIVVPITYLADKNDEIVFRHRNDIYYYSSSTPTTLAFDMDNISQVVIQENYFEGLMKYVDSTYHFKYYFDNHTLEKNLLDQSLNLDINALSAFNHIFGAFSLTDKTYFNLQTSTFDDIPIDENILSFKKSKDHLLFLSQCADKYCLTSFIDGDFSEFQFSFKSKPEIYSKGNNEFLMVEKIDSLQHQLVAINKEGKYVDKMTIHGENLTSDQGGIEKGHLGGLIFYNNNKESLSVILQRHSKFHHYEIPFRNSPDFHLELDKAGNNLILKSEDEDEAGIYLCALGKDPVNLGYSEHTLLMAIDNANTIALIVDKTVYDYEMLLVDTASQMVVETKDLSSQESIDFYYKFKDRHNKFQISEEEYLITFSGHDWLSTMFFNTEFFTFNSSSYELFNGPNINNNLFQSSDPHDFKEGDGHLFFVAKSPLDNSYQLFHVAHNFTTTIDENIPNHASIDVFPNPAKDFISLSESYDYVRIFNNFGVLKRLIEDYQRENKIEISNLPSGIYYVELFGNNTRTRGQFIKI